MKLLCDVCENAVASVICCADEAALCLSCDSRIHAANKLASKHQRMTVLAEQSEVQAAVCDICQDRPSFFFCIEDRALLCRECDASIHSVNALAAKHRRFLLTGIQVGMSMPSSTSPETNSAISMEQHVPDASPLDAALMEKPTAGMHAVPKASNQNEGGLCDSGEPSNRAMKRPFQQAVTPTMETSSRKAIHGGMCKTGTRCKDAFSYDKALTPGGATTGKTLRSYTVNKQGTLSIPSLVDTRRVDSSSTSSSNPTTISIRRISAGRVPFVAPVLSTLRAALKQENDSDHKHRAASDRKIDGGGGRNMDFYSSSMGDIHSSIMNNSNNDNINSNVTMDVDDCPPVSSDNVSDYLMSGISGWRLDELLTDLIGVCDSGPSLSPPKEGNAHGFGTHEDPAWYAELDFMAEHDLSPSQEEGVALVPETPSPPTASGLVTSRGKPTCPAAQPWEFDYLFAEAHEYSSDFSVVPDIDGQRPCLISTSPIRDKKIKKRRIRVDL